MDKRFHRNTAIGMFALLFQVLAGPAARPAEMQAGGEPGTASASEARPGSQDLVLAIDVSQSMVERWKASDGSTRRPSDPGGIRWDGLQFVLDVARPGDRVALVLFRAQAEVITRRID